MALPERLYYPLDKAIKKINLELTEKEHIDIGDLLHFATNKDLELCIPFSSEKYIKSGNHASVLFPVFSLSKEKFKKCIKKIMRESPNSSTWWLETYYGRFSTNNKICNNDIFLEPCFSLVRANLLLSIDSSDFFAISSNDELININWLNIPRNSYSIEKTFNDKSKIVDDSLIKYLSLVFKKPIKIKLSDLVITDNELNLLINGGQQIAEREMFNRNQVGRKENTFSNAVLDIAIATRKKYPSCTGESLARKINDLLQDKPRSLSFGSIKQLISKNISAPKDKDVKLEYELVIPDKLLHLKNK